MRLLRSGLLLLPILACTSPPTPRDAPVPAGEERWAAVILNGQRAGHIHYVRTLVEEEGRVLVVTCRDAVQRVTTAHLAREISSRVEIAETAEGRPVRFDLTMRNGGTQRVRGEVRDGTMVLFTVQEGSELEADPIPLGVGTRGPFGMEVTRVLEGLEEGTTYSMPALDLEMPLPGVIHNCTVRGAEEVEVLGERMTLTRIEVALDSPTFAHLGPIGPKQIWVDETCRVWKEAYEFEGIGRVHEWGPAAKAVGRAEAYRPIPHVEGNRYRHPSLGLRFDKPDDWTFEEDRETDKTSIVRLTPDSGDGVIRVMAVERPYRDLDPTLDAIAPDDERKEKKRWFGIHEGSEITFPGGKAIVIEPGACCMSPYASATFLFVLEGGSRSDEKDFDRMVETIELHAAMGDPPEDALPPVEEAPLILEGHYHPVTAIALTRDDRRLISAGLDGTIKTWDLHAGIEVWTRSHGEKIWGAALGPDGTRLVSGSDDGTVRIWDLESGKTIHTMTGHDGRVGCVAYGPDGRVVASGGAMDKVIRLWSAEDGTEIRTLPEQDQGLLSLAFGPGGETLASGSYDGVVKIWDPGTGEEQVAIDAHGHWVTGLSFSPDGKTLATSSADTTLRLWDTGTWSERRTLEGHKLFVLGVAFGPDGRSLASAGMDGCVIVWDAGSGEVVRSFSTVRPRVSGRPAAQVVAFTADGSYLLAGTAHGSIMVWDLAGGGGPVTEEALRERTERAGMRVLLPSDMTAIQGLAFSPDGRLLAAAGTGKSIKIWEAGREAPRTFWIDRGEVRTLDFLPGGSVLISGHDRSSEDDFIFWDPEKGRLARSLPARGEAGVEIADLHPEGGIVACIGKAWQDTSVTLRSLTSGEVVGEIGHHEKGIQSLAYSPDGRMMATGSLDRTVRIWNTTSGEELHRLEGHAGAVTCVAFGPEGKILVSGGHDRTTRIWDTRTGEMMHTLGGASDCVTAIAVSPDGKILAVGIRDNSIKLWDLGCATEIDTYAGHEKTRGGTGVTCLEFRPDGKALASGGGDGTVRLWKVPVVP